MTSLFNKLNGDNHRKFDLNTKWKDLITYKNKNYCILQADMYHMNAYSKKYGTSAIRLLYPVNEEMKDHETIIFDSGDGTRVSFFKI